MGIYLDYFNIIRGDFPNLLLYYEGGEGSTGIPNLYYIITESEMVGEFHNPVE